MRESKVKLIIAAHEHMRETDRNGYVPGYGYVNADQWNEAARAVDAANNGASLDELSEVCRRMNNGA